MLSKIDLRDNLKNIQFDGYDGKSILNCHNEKQRWYRSSSRNKLFTKSLESASKESNGNGQIILGVTGGIGSGKTTACNHLQHLGFSIYNSDERAKELMQTSKSLVEKITSIFGENAYHNGKLHRPWIGEQVFANKTLLERLNAVVHPVVGEDFNIWCGQQDSWLVVKEAAILIESGAYKSVDHLVLITAPEEQRIQRVIARDKVSRNAAQQRIRNQWSDEKKIPYADFVIANSTVKSLQYQIEEIVSQLRS